MCSSVQHHRSSSVEMFKDAKNCSVCSIKIPPTLLRSLQGADGDEEEE